MRKRNTEIGKIQNGMTMNNPLSAGLSKGDFSHISNKNKTEDLKRIIDSRESFSKYRGKNKIRIPKKCLVINLDERPDRWEKFQSKNQDLFEKMEVERFSAVKRTDVREAIFLSHLGCLEITSGQECVLVLEDDCELANGWYSKLQQAFLDLPEDWDVLVGNHYFFSSMEILSDNIAKPVGRASTANFVIYRNTCLEKIKKEFHLRDESLEDIDHFLTDPITSIKNFTVWPMVAREFVSISDHYGKIRNMENRVREHAFLFPYIDSDTYYPSIDCW